VLQGYGCGDGFPNYAWQYGIVGIGLVSGGPYEDQSFCSAYTLPPCNHYESKNDTLPSCESGPPSHTPACPTQCDSNTTYKTPFAKDSHTFSKAYAVPANEQAIMTEIFTNGPVTAGFNVYSDWIHYPLGTGANQVYTPQGGTEMGGHAIRIVGWGVSTNDSNNGNDSSSSSTNNMKQDSGEKYWIIANSFGKKWGLDGWFKMAKGKGAAGIEQSVVAGIV